MKNYDVIVVGGGLSGVCAAISAARGGARVLLAEKGNCLGGAATNALVMPFMPYATKINGKNIQLSAGIFKEITKRLDEMEAFEPSTEDSPFDLKNMNFKEEYLKVTLNRMVLEAGVEVLFHAYLVSAEAKSGKVHGVSFATKSGVIYYEAKYFIDCSGDADLSVACGAKTRLGRSEDNMCQPMTLCFRLCNVDEEEFLREKEDIQKLYKKHRQEGKIKNIREDVLIFDTLIPGVLHFNSTRICKKNPTNPVDLTVAEIEAREQVFELYLFLKKNFTSFKNAELIMTASEIGVRESRMIDGEYLLKGTELVACTKFEDAIAAGNYNLDIHNPDGSGTTHHWIKPGEFYTIPYRSLIPKGFSNLLVAGRCISTDHEAQAGCRIMPICATLGQAAGTAASLADGDVRKVDIKKLQETLIKNGAFLG